MPHHAGDAAAAQQQRNSGLRLSGPLLHSLAGFFSGLLATVLTYPLDFVKVRYIAQDGQRSRALDGVTRFKGVAHAIRTSYGVAGLAPMYQGVGAAVCASSASWAIYFGTFRHLQACYTSAVHGTPSTTSAKPRSAGRVGDMLAATGAGVVATVATCPLWLVKTRMQLQRGAGPGVFVYKGTWHGLRHIARTEGLAGLYSGLMPSLMMVSHASIQLTLYEYFKEAASSMRGNWGLEEGGRLNSAELAAVTLSSKCIASMFTTPLLVLRIRLQDPRNVSATGEAAVYRGVWQSLRTIVVREGVAGLYRGLVPTLARTLPGALVTFLTYEHISAALFACFEPEPVQARAS